MLYQIRALLGPSELGYAQPACLVPHLAICISSSLQDPSLVSGRTEGISIILSSHQDGTGVVAALLFRRRLSGRPRACAWRPPLAI